MRDMRKNVQFSGNVHETSCVFDFIQDESMCEISENNKAILKEFNDKIRKIQIIFTTKGIDLGIALMMVKWKFGVTWRRIPNYMFDEIIDWCEKNWFRHLQIISPKTHEYQMDTEPSIYGYGESYRDWFNKLDDRNKQKEINFQF